MATDIEKLIVQLSADMRRLESGMNRARFVSDRNMKAIEARAAQLDKRLSSIGSTALRGLVAPLSGIAAALSAQEVLRYADAWTKAKNSLAVAGVTGENQIEVLDRLFRSAQANATPIGSLADLFGKAAQASDNLGASQEDLLRFSDGVATSLLVAGTSAEEASGALQQLGQLLGSAKVQAEEFNSVNDGARPILIAVANGLDAAGGSVNKLKQLVNAGKVSGKQFFDAFLKGLPTVQAMAANATETISQGITKVNNAFTRYIGQTDESLSGSQRLVAGLNALADDFDQTADIALKFASVLAAALVGRAIGGMLAALPAAAAAIMQLVAAFRAGSLSVALFTRALGPIGLIVGLAAGAAIAFGKWGDSIDDATRALADQAAQSGAIEGMINDVKKAQDAYKAAIKSTAGAQTSASTSIVADTKREFEAKKSLLELELQRQRALVAVQQASLAAKSAELKTSIGDQVFTRVDTNRTGFSDPKVGRFVNLPDDITGLQKTQEAIDASPVTAEIKKIRAEMELTEISADKLDKALKTTFNEGTPGKPGSTDTSSTKSGTKEKTDDYQREVQSIAERTQALLAANRAQASINPLVNDYGYALEKAKARQDLLTAAQKAGREITPALATEIDKVADAYARASAESGRLAEAQQKAQEAIDFQKEVLNGALSDMRSALEDGKLTWEDLGNVAVNVLNKIADRLQSLLVDQLFKSGGLFGNLLGAVTGGTTGGGVASGAVHAAAPVAASGLRAPRVPNMAAVAATNNAPAHVVVSVDDDGAIQAYVAKQGQRNKVEVLHASKASLDQYRRGQLPQDVEKHLRSPRVRGTI